MKISVALCTYNGTKYLAAQLDSIFLQALPVDEIVVCDDNSTDDTVGIIKRFDAAHPGIIKLHINNQNLGGRKNFEKALTLCTGDIIFLSDQDDIWMPGKTASVMKFFDANHDCWGVFTNGYLINENNSVLEGSLLDFTFFKAPVRKDYTRDNLLYWSLLLGNIISGASLAIRKDCLPSVLPFKLNFGRNLWHDAWIGFVLLGKGKLEYLDECQIQYRVHESQQVGIADSEDDFFTRQVLTGNSNAGGSDTKYYLRYLSAWLFIDQFIKSHEINSEIKQRIAGEYAESKRIYFSSQPFLVRKLRLLKWYVKGINDISFIDLISL